MNLEYNWGRVIPKAADTGPPKVTAEIDVKNTGTEPLHITEVRPSCGCTSAPLDKDTLAPGESTVLRVSLNLPQQNGPISKYVTIRTNEPNASSTHLLVLKADVQRPIQLSAAYFGFNNATVGEPTVAEIMVTSILDEPVTLSVAEATYGLTVSSEMPIVLQPNIATPLRVSYTSSKSGTFNIQLVLATSVEGYERFTVAGYGTINEPSK